MNLLVSLSSCKDSALAVTLQAIKNALTLIQIIVPILLILMATLHFINLMKDPDNKKILPKIKNSFIAAAVVFFIPLLVNVTMNLFDDSFTISECWNKSSISNNNPTYMDPYEKKEKSFVYVDPNEYK